MPIDIRLATAADIPALKDLIPASARGLSQAYYSDAQIEAAIRYVFGVDSQLIADRTYYVAVDDGAIVGCGGWRTADDESTGLARRLIIIKPPRRQQTLSAPM